MFLASLNNEQKELFLELCIHAAQSDGAIELQEHTAMTQYIAEMGLNDYPTEVSIPLEEVFEKLKAISTQAELRIITIEIMALLLVDDEYDVHEKLFMDALKQNFEIADEELNNEITLIKRLIDIYDRLKAFITGESVNP